MEKVDHFIEKMYSEDIRDFLSFTYEFVYLCYILTFHPSCPTFSYFLWFGGNKLKHYFSISFIIDSSLVAYALKFLKFTYFLSTTLPGFLVDQFKLSFLPIETLELDGFVIRMMTKSRILKEMQHTCKNNLKKLAKKKELQRKRYKICKISYKMSRYV